METNIIFKIREFLNKEGHNGLAAIAAKAETVTYGENKTRFYTEASMEISDCSRKIALEFDASSESWDNTLYKIDLLISTFINFRTALYTLHDIELAEDKKQKDGSSTGTCDSSSSTNNGDSSICS
jgi:hypothetical protein